MVDKKASNFLKIQIGGLSSGSQVTAEMSPDDFIDATPAKLEGIALAINGAIQPLVQKLSSLKDKPSEFAVEFGINVGGEAGVPFVTKGSLGANFKISLKWKSEG